MVCGIVCGIVSRLAEDIDLIIYLLPGKWMDECRSLSSRRPYFLQKIARVKLIEIYFLTVNSFELIFEQTCVHMNASTYGDRKRWTEFLEQMFAVIVSKCNIWSNMADWDYLTLSNKKDAPLLIRMLGLFFKEKWNAHKPQIHLWLQKPAIFAHGSVSLPYQEISGFFLFITPYSSGLKFHFCNISLVFSLWFV